MAAFGGGFCFQEFTEAEYLEGDKCSQFLPVQLFWAVRQIKEVLYPVGEPLPLPAEGNMQGAFIWHGFCLGKVDYHRFREQQGICFRLCGHGIMETVFKGTEGNQSVGRRLRFQMERMLPCNGYENIGIPALQVKADEIAIWAGSVGFWREVPAEQPVDKVGNGSIGQGKDTFESPVVNPPVWVPVDKKPSFL